MTELLAWPVALDPGIEQLFVKSNTFTFVGLNLLDFLVAPSWSFLRGSLGHLPKVISW